MEDKSPRTVEVATVYLRRTRAHELIKIQKAAESEGTRLTDFFKRKAVDTETHLLTQGQLLLFYIILQVPLYQLNWYARIAREFGGMNAFLSYILVTLFGHFPLFVLYTTMAFYCKKGYVKFWDCLPIGQGLAYSCILITLLIEINNIHAAALTILYFYESFYGVSWKKCNFKGADKDCIPHYPSFEVPLNNCEIASDQYNKYNKRNVYHEPFPPWNEFGSIKIDAAIMIWLCCFIVFVTSMLGFKKFSSCMVKLLMIVVFGIATLLNTLSTLHSLIHRKHVLSMYKGYKETFKPELWAQALLINLPTNSPGTLIYLAAVSPDNMRSPLVTAFKVFTGKIVLSTLFMTWYAFASDQAMTIYSVFNVSCLHEIGMLQFTIFVDVLADLPLPFIWLNLHYFSIFVLHMSATIIAVTATVNSLCQAIPSLAKYRFRTCGIICLSLALISMARVTQIAIAYDKAIKRGLTYVFLIINLFSLLGIVFIYGVKTLKHDILFIYGNTLTRMFWYSITLLPIVFLLVTVYMVHASIELGEFVFSTRSLVINGIIFLPMVIFPICQAIKNATSKQKGQSLFVPAKTWGVERKLRRAREAFNPDKEVQYNTPKLKCDHFCLVYSTSYKREVFSQTMLYQSLLTQMTESKNDRD